MLRAGDVDGDLVDDFAVSSTLYEVNSAKVGAVFVVYGSNLLVSGKVEDFVTGSKGGSADVQFDDYVLERRND